MMNASCPTGCVLLRGCAQVWADAFWSSGRHFTCPSVAWPTVTRSTAQNPPCEMFFSPRRPLVLRTWCAFLGARKARVTQASLPTCRKCCGVTAGDRDYTIEKKNRLLTTYGSADEGRLFYKHVDALRVEFNSEFILAGRKFEFESGK